MAVKKYKRSFLNSVVSEMNNVMQMEPPLDGKDVDDAKLLTAIRQIATGRGKVEDAIRATDFENEAEGAVVFSATAKQFFIDEGLWDDETKSPIVNPATTAAPEETEEPAPTPVATKAGEKKLSKEGEMATQAAVKGKVAAKTKSRGTATQKKAAAPKKDVELTKYGHRVGSKAAFVDTALIAGTTEKACVSGLVRKFEMQEPQAIAKFRVHMAYLKKEKGAKITEKDGHFHAR